uniref:Sulfotransferase domain-containing protein n=1 Tax=Rhodosorus marinus TaxID=101924 RepID=A0A7S0BT33_9RHOD|mmetsp:Transcript_7801/g.11562  ORF Transcript_7801/g.11562 Transcript_7801/m.11562 type:complete len:555 (+) Transcript_7801:288-1952(+)|eukprot:CAMPEP_0184752074 /NCGR_PEP_ID=MMETSP0315-20130426/43389_1 /TAXON_ID=101924 /ORGANISM="Rhodosorus marinus, Strain UTEX LB 2760" /LENGTH=554 /DNA_ID=CAMNT_0027231391 /DNA_START=263 /DNA_END=1927 /DNA_ORIENTATION=+
MDAKADMLLERPAMRTKGMMFVVVIFLGLLAMLSVSPVQGWDTATTSYNSSGLPAGSTERTETTTGKLTMDPLDDDEAFENKPEFMTPETSNNIYPGEIPGQLGAKPEDETNDTIPAWLQTLGVQTTEGSLSGIKQERGGGQSEEDPSLGIAQGEEPISTETNEVSLTADPTQQSGTPNSSMPGFTPPVTHWRPLPIPDRSENRKTAPACAASLPKAGGYLFVMSAHTGSTAMMSQLTQHPDVHYDLNNFEPLNSFDFEELNPLDAVAWAREYFSKRTGSSEVNPDNKLPGFKMSPVTVVKAPDAFRRLVHDFNLRIIWNYRENVFKWSVGRYPYYYLGDNTAVGGIEASSGVDDRCAVGVGCSFDVIDNRDLHCIMVRFHRVDQYVRKAVSILTEETGCYLEMAYEDYLKDSVGQMTKAFEFLGLRPIVMEPKRAKATSNNMCEVVANYSSVCAAFGECSAWKDMLEDPASGCSCSNYKYESLGGDDVNPLCYTTKPEDNRYHRWCGAFNYEEDMERIQQLRTGGENAMRDFKERVLGSEDEVHREPTVIKLQ